MSILTVSNLQKNFGKVTVLKNISLSVENGEVVSIIGSSGSGKSTLLRCINQLETPDAGEIVIDQDTLVFGKDGEVCYADKNTLKNIRMKTGLVFQNFNLFPHFSVLRNITEAPIHVMNVPRAEAEKEYGIAETAWT